MSTSDIERNKQTVDRLFASFRTGDTNAFDGLFADDYVQHNTRGQNGLAATKAMFAQMGPLEVEVHRVIAEGDLVAVHSHFKSLGVAAVDIFRVDAAGTIIEHWDVLQQVPDTTASGNDMFSQVT